MEHCERRLQFQDGIGARAQRLLPAVAEVGVWRWIVHPDIDSRDVDWIAAAVAQVQLHAGLWIAADLAPPLPLVVVCTRRLATREIAAAVSSGGR